MKERKIVQLVVNRHAPYVLADDGTLWYLSSSGLGWRWIQIPSLPPIADESGWPGNGPRPLSALERQELGVSEKEEA